MGARFDWEFFWDHLLRPEAPFLEGFVRTIYISVLAMVLATVVGLGVALLTGSKHWALRFLGGVYVWVIRGTPLLVQLVIIYLGLAASGIYTFNDVHVFGLNVRGVVQAAVVTLVIHESAYISEIIRAGIQSVPKGQTEAGLSLGLSRWEVMRSVILPQALRFMVPPLGNTFNGLMKATSILSIIGVSDMFLVAQSISSTTFRTFEIFIVAALYYLLLTTVWTFIQGRLEARLDVMVGIDRRPPRRFARRRARPGAITSPAVVAAVPNDAR